jgi:hypothetical protein
MEEICLRENRLHYFSMASPQIYGDRLVFVVIRCMVFWYTKI